MPKSSNKKKNNIYKNILLLLITIFVFLALFEISLRLFGIAHDYGPLKGLFQKDELLDYKMSPNYSGKFVRQEFEISIATNSKGLRDVEYSAKRHNDFRILSLGDSFTWGAYGTELNQTFVKILEKKLNENSNGLNYQVINAGVPGYGTDQETAYLKNEGYKFKPDIVIINFFVGNDFLDNSRRGELTVVDGILTDTGSRQNIYEKIRIFLLDNFYSYGFIEKGIINIFNNLVQKYIKSRVQYDKYESQIFLKPATKGINDQFSKTKEILDDVNSYIKSKNIKLLILVIPLNYQVDDNLKEIFIKNNYAINEKFDMEQPQKILREWANQNNVELIDLLPELSGLEDKDKLYWKLNGHFNARGNQAAGEIIFNELTHRQDLIKI